MGEKINQLLTIHVDIFERLLKAMWKNSVEVSEKTIYTQEKKFFVEFSTNDNHLIKLEILVEMNEKNQIDRIGMLYKIYCMKLKCLQQYMALSFLYQCPYDLELCNQFGLYSKKDAKKMERIKDQREMHRFKIEQNILKNNLFYIFNMNRIHDDCADTALLYSLQEIHQMVMEWNSLVK